MGRFRAPVERIQARRLAVAAQLADELRGVALPAAEGPLTHGGMLRDLRLLGGVVEISAQESRALRQRLVTGLTNAFQSMKFTPSDFGAQTLGELAEVFVQMVERVRYGKYAPQELRVKVRGLRGVFAGELFERLVQNMRELNDDLVLMAQMELADINDLARGSSPLLKNANGDTVLLTPPFGPVRKAVDINIWSGGQKLKSVDMAHITIVGGGSQLSVVMLVETEIKLPGAASQFGPQIGVAQGRFAGADFIEMSVEGYGKIRVPRENLIFNTRSGNRVAVTPTPQNTQQMRFSFTRAGSYPESYLRVGVSVKVDEVYRLTTLLF
jgi:hypothetical protein